LPPNNYERNAFRNSIFYEHARNILFVRKERMDSIGEFVVLILHSMSHIKCGQMTDDASPQFLRQFYKVSVQFDMVRESINSVYNHDEIPERFVN